MTEECRHDGEVLCQNEFFPYHSALFPVRFFASLRMTEGYQNDRGTACQNEFFPCHPLLILVLLSFLYPPVRFPVLLSVFRSSCPVFRASCPVSGPPVRFPVLLSGFLSSCLFPILLPLFLASCLFLRRSERSEGSAVQSEIFLFCSRGSSSWYSLDALISSYNKLTRRLMVNRNRAKGIRPIRYALTTKP